MSTRTNKQAVYLRTGHQREINWRLLGRICLFLTSAAALAWGVVYLQRTDVLPIQKIQALGTFDHVSESMLRDVVAETTRKGYFSVKVAHVQQAVERLPWVAKAHVSRVWPDTLAINVTERQAYALRAKGGIVNQHGVVFFPEQKTYPAGLPVLDGPIGMERNMAENYRLAKTIISELGLDIVRLNMDSRRAIDLQLSNGIKLILGREDTRHRLERFARVYKKVLMSRANDIASVDMRYSNGLSVGWRKARASG